MVGVSSHIGVGSHLEGILKKLTPISCNLGHSKQGVAGVFPQGSRCFRVGFDENWVV